MCAIIGYRADGEPDLDLISRVFEASKIRGLHAFGYAFWRGGLLHTYRFLDLKELLAHLAVHRPQALIGHCRYSTSGDYRNLENNQPVRRGSRALVFNGVIHMGTRTEMEAEYGVQLVTENDGEIVLAQEPFEPVGFVRGLKGSFAGLILDASGIIALRNTRRPAHIVEGQGFSLVISTSDIATRAAVPGPVKELPPFQAVRIS